MLLTLGMVLLATAASASGFGTLLEKKGDWTIYRDKDAMTDKVSCVAIYKGDGQFQLADDSFAIDMRGRGGVESYQYRIDDQPPTDLQLATDIEQQVGVVLIKDPGLSSILAGKRLRIQVLTLLSSEPTFDINLSDVSAAHAVIVGPQCNS
jgi:hypothetical protein